MPRSLPDSTKYLGFCLQDLRLASLASDDGTCRRSGGRAQACSPSLQIIRYIAREDPSPVFPDSELLVV